MVGIVPVLAIGLQFPVGLVTLIETTLLLCMMIVATLIALNYIFLSL
jgi:hypothetical protein